MNKTNWALTALAIVFAASLRSAAAPVPAPLVGGMESGLAGFETVQSLWQGGSETQQIVPPYGRPGLSPELHGAGRVYRPGLSPELHGPGRVYRPGLSPELHGPGRVNRPGLSPQFHRRNAEPPIILRRNPAAR